LRGDRGCHYYSRLIRILLLRGFNGPVHQSIASERHPLYPLVPPPSRLQDTKMSLLATPLTFLLFFSGFTVAQIVSPNCESTWSWSFNSLNQDPCKVAATMLGTCNGNTFTIGPLQPGYSYYGPSGVDDSNLCKCSTVGYSLLSACGGCQGASWITWSEYAFNCTKTLPSPQFPNAVPSGIRVPHWALLDPTYENLWDFNQSYIAGGGNSLPCLFPPLLSHTRVLLL
jgi:hypothetical protein